MKESNETYREANQVADSLVKHNLPLDGEGKCFYFMPDFIFLPTLADVEFIFFRMNFNKFLS